MGVRFPSVFTNNSISNPLPANATETIISTTPPLTPTLDFAVIFLSWMIAILAGTGTTALVFRIRRGLLVTSPLVGAAAWTFTIAAGNSAVLGCTYPDGPGAISGQQYVLTCSQTGATAAGTINDIAITAFAL